MKRLMSCIMCLALLLLGAVSVQATEASTENPIQLDSLYINTTVTTLTISGGVATCTGTITGYSGITTKVVIALFLERKTAGSSTWSGYASDPAKTINSFFGSYQMKKSVDRGYQYRVRAVYTAYSGTKHESITGFSQVVAY